ncbi:hypothetical protein Bhyg_15239, partial [Pseudolycoriella hygida]
PASSGPNRGQTRGHNRSIQPLNVSTISQHSQKLANGGPRMMLNTTPLTSISSSNHNNSHLNLNTKHHIGAREALTSLGLLCLVSLLLALLSLIFLLKISPGRDPPIENDDYIIVYDDVTLALCALSLTLNLSCLLVCGIQFLFAVKLVRAPATSGRGNKYLQKSSVSRVCAVGGFFISIPIFLTGIILYTFTQFHSTPAIITSVLIGIGIVFCGCAMVHNVFVWQKEKTICVRQNGQTPINLNLSLHAPISTISPPVQYMNHPINHMHLNHNNSNHNHTPVTQVSHTTVTPVTPLSPNHSHVSFNHSYVPTYGVRNATPPTPKVLSNIISSSRDASPAMANGTLELSNVTSSNSHEFSTLV